MSQRTGYKQLSRLLEENDWRLVQLPANVTPFALAKCAWEHWAWEDGYDAYYNPDCRLYDAIGDLLSFIQSKFVGGVEYSRDVSIPNLPASPGYYLWLALDVTGKFSEAARMLMDFTVRGEAKHIRKARMKAEQYSLNLD